MKNLLKAVAKACARKISDLVTTSQIDNSKQKAYAKTGKEIADARKRGQYINGSAAYHKNLRQIRAKAYRSGQDRKAFINDL